mmetsp:Transcript_20594/g.52179  ORF Transcript_20594/g.52179 Transcript_20594/m.52179 type:complete len:112 (-) Transcript_20594:950-1285(-)
MFLFSQLMAHKLRNETRKLGHRLCVYVCSAARLNTDVAASIVALGQRHPRCSSTIVGESQGQQIRKISSDCMTASKTALPSARSHLRPRKKQRCPAHEVICDLESELNIFH